LQKITALHGENIWAESLFGKGTTIHFTIPKNKIDKTNDLIKNP
jgi:signal transduction histidine kinase